MRITKHDKLSLFKTEVVALIIIIILGVIFNLLKENLFFYLITLLIGFCLYFWMLVEEKIHKFGKKNIYFEYTSSYIILGQTFLTLGLLFLSMNIKFISLVSFFISIIMYGVSSSRIILYKIVFKN